MSVEPCSSGLIAAAAATPSARLVLPTLGRAPTTTSVDGCRRSSMRSRSTRRVGVPVRSSPLAASTEAAAVFDRLGVDLVALSAWRWRSTYPDDVDVVRADADRLAAPYAVMAPTVAGVLVAHLQQALASGVDLVDAVAYHARLAGTIAAHDVRRAVKAASSAAVEPRGIDV